jgi:kinesin family member 12
VEDLMVVECTSQ